MGSFVTDVLDDVFGIELAKKPTPQVSTAPKEDLDKEKQDIDAINDPEQTQSKKKRTQAIRNVGGIIGQEVSAIGTGGQDKIFGN